MHLIRRLLAEHRSEVENMKQLSNSRGKWAIGSTKVYHLYKIFNDRRDVKILKNCYTFTKYLTKIPYILLRSECSQQFISSTNYYNKIRTSILSI